MIKFGPAGNSDSFYEQGHKSSVEMPAWLKANGLEAYEYQCSKGVNVGRNVAERIGEEAEKHNILISIHAPYYINLSSNEKDKINSSIDHILKTIKVAKWMGAKRIIFHPGSVKGCGREEALSRAINAMGRIFDRIEEAGLSEINICPETMGKINQLGTIEEIIELCKVDKRMIPAIDFGHIHARSLGGIKSVEDVKSIFYTVMQNFGHERVKNIHCHFSRIEYTNGGEKMHRNLSETEYGPEFELVAEAIALLRFCPVIICESRKHMAEDALILKKIYYRIASKVSKKGDGYS